MCESGRGESGRTRHGLGLTVRRRSSSMSRTERVSSTSVCSPVLPRITPSITSDALPKTAPYRATAAAVAVGCAGTPVAAMVMGRVASAAECRRIVAALVARTVMRINLVAETNKAR